MKFTARIRVDKPSYYKMVKKFNTEAKKQNLQQLLTKGIIKNDNDVIFDTIADEIYIEENGELFSKSNIEEDSVYIVFNDFDIDDPQAYYYLLYCLWCCEKFSYVFIDEYGKTDINYNDALYEIQYEIIKKDNHYTGIFMYDDVITEEEDG